MRSWPTQLFPAAAASYLLTSWRRVCGTVQETDASARRNAFLMLFNCAQALAVDYYLQHADETQAYGDGFQLVVLELTRKVP